MTHSQYEIEFNVRDHLDQELRRAALRRTLAERPRQPSRVAHRVRAARAMAAGLRGNAWRFGAAASARPVIAGPEARA